MYVVFGTHRLVPPDRLIGLGAVVVLDNRPGTRQCVVDGGDFVVQCVQIVFVEIDPLPDDRLIVLVQWNTGHLKRAGTLHAASLDDKRIVTTMSALIDPPAD